MGCKESNQTNKQTIKLAGTDGKVGGYFCQLPPLNDNTEIGGTPTFSSGTPTFCQMGVLNSCFQNPSESSGPVYEYTFTSGLFDLARRPHQLRTVGSQLANEI